MGFENEGKDTTRGSIREPYLRVRHRVRNISEVILPVAGSVLE